MAGPISSKQVKAKKVGTPVPASDMKTMGSQFPPVRAWSNTSTPAVVGTSAYKGSDKDSSSERPSGVCGVHSAGGIGVYGKSTGNAGYFDGALQVNGDVNCTGDVKLTGADCAEEFDCSRPELAGPGTLMVMERDGSLKACDRAYDRKVAGVVAGAGNYRPGIVLDKRAEAGSRVAVSLMGKAFCKVDADFGAIEAGDLLTSSPTLGHAMRAGDHGRSFGAVVGKALVSLDSGQSLIPILLALQ